MTEALAARSDPARAAEIIRRFGRETVAFQGLESQFQHWFDGASVVSFVDTGGAWVAGGAPVGPPDEIAAVARRFCEAAALASRRACFFGAERAFVDATGFPAAIVGEQPVWDTARWDDVLASAPSLRYQLRRASHKGVTVRRVMPGELAEGSELRTRITTLAAAWWETRKMAPMRFLVAVEPFTFAADRTTLIAERDGAVIGIGSAVPVAARGRLFVEDFLRADDAPNGTVELIVDGAMRCAHADGYRELTLGLAPLAGNVARWLRVMSRLASPLYNFAGLRAFKGKLRPQTWEPVYLCAAEGRSTLVALRDSLRAFAGGSLLAFGARTLFTKPATVA
jgi:phosphatidylglycerol lysyltransferase